MSALNTSVLGMFAQKGMNACDLVTRQRSCAVFCRKRQVRCNLQFSGIVATICEWTLLAFPPSPPPPPHPSGRSTKQYRWTTAVYAPWSNHCCSCLNIFRCSCASLRPQPSTPDPRPQTLNPKEGPHPNDSVSGVAEFCLSFGIRARESL